MQSSDADTYPGLFDTPVKVNLVPVHKRVSQKTIPILPLFQPPSDAQAAYLVRNQLVDSSEIDEVSREQATYLIQHFIETRRMGSIKRIKAVVYGLLGLSCFTVAFFLWVFVEKTQEVDEVVVMDLVAEVGEPMESEEVPLQEVSAKDESLQMDPASESSAPVVKRLIKGRVTWNLEGEDRLASTIKVHYVPNLDWATDRLLAEQMQLFTKLNEPGPSADELENEIAAMRDAFPPPISDGHPVGSFQYERASYQRSTSGGKRYKGWRHRHQDSDVEVYYKLYNRLDHVNPKNVEQHLSYFQQDLHRLIQKNMRIAYNRNGYPEQSKRGQRAQANLLWLRNGLNTFIDEEYKRFVNSFKLRTNVAFQRETWKSFQSTKGRQISKKIEKLEKSSVAIDEEGCFEISGIEKGNLIASVQLGNSRVYFSVHNNPFIQFVDIVEPL